MNDDRRLLAELLALIDRTESHEIDCEEFIDRSAGFVEAMARSDVLPEGWPDLVQHLRVCPECEEEFEVLRRLLGEED